MRARRLLCSDVVDVGARDAESGRTGGVEDVLCATDEAGAGGVDGAEVICEGGVAEVEDTGGCDAVAEALWCVSSEFVCRRWILGSWGMRTAVRVGQTQSNMSAPRATETTRSSG